MPQVLRPNAFTNEESTRSEFGTFELNKQVVVSLLTSVVLGIWSIGCHLNNGLFFKEAAICSSIVFFLIFIKSKSIKRD